MVVVVAGISTRSELLLGEAIAGELLFCDAAEGVEVFLACAEGLAEVVGLLPELACSLVLLLLALAVELALCGVVLAGLSEGAGEEPLGELLTLVALLRSAAFPIGG